MPIKSPQIIRIGVWVQLKTTKEINIISATWQILDSLRIESSPHNSTQI